MSRIRNATAKGAKNADDKQNHARGGDGGGGGGKRKNRERTRREQTTSEALCTIITPFARSLPPSLLRNRSLPFQSKTRGEGRGRKLLRTMMLLRRVGNSISSHVILRLNVPEREQSLRCPRHSAEPDRKNGTSAQPYSTYLACSWLRFLAHVPNILQEV